MHNFGSLISWDVSNFEKFLHLCDNWYIFLWFDLVWIIILLYVKVMREVCNVVEWKLYFQICNWLHETWLHETIDQVFVIIIDTWSWSSENLTCYIVGILFTKTILKAHKTLILEFVLNLDSRKMTISNERGTITITRAWIITPSIVFLSTRVGE